MGIPAIIAALLSALSEFFGWRKQAAVIEEKRLPETINHETVDESNSFNAQIKAARDLGTPAGDELAQRLLDEQFRESAAALSAARSPVSGGKPDNPN